MTEGLRFLPWLQRRLRDKSDSAAEFLADCEKCMSNSTKTSRQTAGCGYEMPHPTLPINVPMVHQGCTEQPTVCPGYTTKLPEVYEIGRARRHWEKGALVAFCDGEPPSEQMLRGIELLDGAVSEAECWRAPETK